MKCPKCGAQLQENAQFCFYCMHSLVEKVPDNPRKAKVRCKRWLMYSVAAVALVGTLAAVFLSLKPATTVAEQDPVITTIEDFQLRATYLTGKDGLSDLWDPDGLLEIQAGVDRQGDTWKIYTTDIFMDGVDFRAGFCEGGTEVVLSFADLTEENIDDGLRLVECAVSAVYNYTFINLHDILTDHDVYPAKKIDPEERIWALANLPDPAGEKIDAGTNPVIIRKSVITMTDQLMYVEIRTRTYENKVYYDVVILHTIMEQ